MLGCLLRAWPHCECLDGLAWANTLHLAQPATQGLASLAPVEGAAAATAKLHGSPPCMASMLELVHGLASLHERGIVHRDLK